MTFILYTLTGAALIATSRHPDPTAIAIVLGLLWISVGVQSLDSRR